MKYYKMTTISEIKKTSVLQPVWIFKTNTLNLINILLMISMYSFECLFVYDLIHILLMTSMFKCLLGLQCRFEPLGVGHISHL